MFCFVNVKTHIEIWFLVEIEEWAPEGLIRSWGAVSHVWMCILLEILGHVSQDRFGPAELSPEGLDPFS